MQDPFRDAMVGLIPRLRSYALGLVSSTSEADDLVQDALVRAWRYRNSFEAGSNFAAWMFRILRNEHLDQLPRRRAVVEDVDGRFSAQLACGPDQEWRVRYGELLEAVRRLPPENREALLMVVATGLTYAEAAEVCGCELNVFKQRVHRARARLAQMIDSDVRVEAAPRRAPSPRGRGEVLRPAAAVAAAGVLAVGLTGTAHAQSADPLPDLRRLEQRLVEQERRLADQAALIDAQQARIEALEAAVDPLEVLRGTGTGDQGPHPDRRLALLDQAPPNAVTEDRDLVEPVAEARPSEGPEEVAALPTSVGVLTPPGRLVIDPSIEYVRTSNNRLVFRGVEIVPGIPLGVIEASDVARDTAVATLAARYGLTDRLEVEVRVPYVYRHDRLLLLAQPDPEFDRDRELDGNSLGDVEAALRYQINSGGDGWPIFVGNLRIKSPTGISPYDVDYDEDGVATSLSTGSGFWSVEGGVTMLYPSDPAIIFAGLSYLHSFSRDIDKQIGEAFVGRVEPGASIGAQAGFGLSLNPRFSVSFGYSHNYIFPTKSDIGGQKQETRSLQVGSLQMGWSFRLSERLTLNNSFEFGVTSDAPDLRVVVRTPWRF